jgi:hypothetical protein
MALVHANAAQNAACAAAAAGDAIGRASPRLELQETALRIPAISFAISSASASVCDDILFTGSPSNARTLLPPLTT